MRGIVLLAAAVAVLAAGGSAAAGTGSDTWLRITYWEKGIDAGEPVRWSLRCNPPGGTLARPAVACRRIAAGGLRLFVPIPSDMACTMIYGGPQVARVVGVVSGRRVWATFSREDGCEIARWNRVSPWLLPPAGLTS
jgi:hypothetical protein